MRSASRGRPVAIGARAGLDFGATDDHTAVLRLLSDRRDELTGERRRTVNRLHRVLRDPHPGGAARRLTADRAARLLRSIRSTGAVDQERKLIARELIAGVRRIGRALVANRRRCQQAVAVSGSTLTEILGISDVLAAKILGHTGDIARFASADHYAGYTGTAPIEASSGDQTRHRLSRAGNRSPNHALHMAARVQTLHPGLGPIHYPAQTPRAQDTDRSAPQPQTPTRQGRLPPAPSRPAPLSVIFSGIRLDIEALKPGAPVGRSLEACARYDSARRHKACDRPLSEEGERRTPTPTHGRLYTARFVACVSPAPAASRRLTAPGASADSSARSDAPNTSARRPSAAPATRT